MTWPVLEIDLTGREAAVFSYVSLNVGLKASVLFSTEGAFRIQKLYKYAFILYYFYFVCVGCRFFNHYMRRMSTCYWYKSFN